MHNPLTAREYQRRITSAETEIAHAERLLESDPHAAEEHAYTTLGILKHLDKEFPISTSTEKKEIITKLRNMARIIINRADYLQGRPVKRNPYRRNTMKSSDKRPSKTKEWVVTVTDKALLPGRKKPDIFERYFHVRAKTKAQAAKAVRDSGIPANRIISVESEEKWRLGNLYRRNPIRTGGKRPILRKERRREMAMRVRIDGEDYEVERIQTYGALLMIETDGGDFYIAKDSEQAGEAAYEYWKDMARNDPKEFTALVGEEALVQWGLGQYAGPGTTQVQGLEEWLDLWRNIPEEQWASYDGTEQDVERINKELKEALEDEGIDWKPTVAYRWN